MGIEGKYQLVKNENLYEYLIALGAPEDLAKLALEGNPKIEIKIDGKAVTINTEAVFYSFCSSLIVDQEVEEKSLGDVLKSTTKLADDSITIMSTKSDGKKVIREYKLSGSELILTLSSKDPKIPTATRIYKKI